jgi:hypothetical protein
MRADGGVLYVDMSIHGLHGLHGVAGAKAHPSRGERGMTAEDELTEELHPGPELRAYETGYARGRRVGWWEGFFFGGSMMGVAAILCYLLGQRL